MLAVDFDTTPVGPYSLEALEADWPGSRWVTLDPERTEIIEGPPAFSGRSLRHKFTGGTRVHEHSVQAGSRSAAPTRSSTSATAYASTKASTSSGPESCQACSAAKGTSAGTSRTAATDGVAA